MSRCNRELWRRTETWAPGDSSTRTLILGDRVQVDGEVFPGLGLLRIAAFGGDPTANALEAVIALGDGGSALGPVDCPLAITLETPATVYLTRRGGLASTCAVAVSLTPVSADGPAYASRTFPGALNAIYGIPQWVRAVGISGGTFTFQDASGGAISAAIATGRKPALAARLLCNAAGTITYWY